MGLHFSVFMVTHFFSWRHSGGNLICTHISLIHSDSIVCLTVCHSWGRHHIHKRWVWPWSCALPKERGAAGHGCVLCWLYPGNSSCYTGIVSQRHSLLLRKNIFEDIIIAMVKSPVNTFISQFGLPLPASLVHREVFMCFSWWTTIQLWFPLCSLLSLKS